MNLIEVYIYEVTRRLPNKNREDIGLELKSTIEDMLPEKYSEDEVKKVLVELGNPAVLASEYNERPMHLIGPKYYDLYMSLLKMIVPIAVVIAFISVVAKYLVGFEGGDTVLNMGLMILGEGIWSILNVFMQVFFWLTLTFAILERTDHNEDKYPRTMSLQKWTPDDLKNISYIPQNRAVSKGYVFGSLLWTAIWGTIYFNADHLAGVYEGTGEGLEFILPALNQEVLNSFWPLIVIVIGLEIVFALTLFIKNQWTKKIAFFNVIREVIAVIVLIFLITNSNLLNPEFLAYMSNILNIAADQIRNFIIGLTLILFPIFSIYNSVEGYRKANR
ncbi:hypothetical protein [Ureibacillus chungkukjangi]|uniref:Uncharacterized protein n=1 Tax=Ureibacillus chungkukjangi TaxID=1202712 RepID=A0A318U429_9BACL|nr:hypothetical protein [Ureibacillus chungkukjangi]MCM3388741.1 hypothetical protein [Ureibacillus chungkukjangi]PYF06649.1 hypothetical protein BJ095_10870 [Ureibacillus chungkukjangi]